MKWEARESLRTPRLDHWDPEKERAHSRSRIVPVYEPTLCAAWSFRQQVVKGRRPTVVQDVVRVSRSGPLLARAAPRQRAHERVKMKASSLTIIILIVGGCGADVASSVEIGPIQPGARPMPPALTIDDEGLPEVGLRCLITGQRAPGRGKYIYLLVNPLNNMGTHGLWWVQGQASESAGTFAGPCQFGEVDTGRGECFVVVAIQTDHRYGIGERLNGLPSDVKGSAALIVKRSR